MNKSTRTCSFEGCDETYYAKSLCFRHYRQQLKGRDLKPLGRTKVTVPLEERFWSKVNKEAPRGCWEWMGSINPSGYGVIWTNGRPVVAHRASWELANEPIPDGMVIDHRCANRCCVNPGHLRVVTPAQNSQHLTGPQKVTPSGVRGVTWDKRNKTWNAQVGFKGRNYYGGRYSTIEAAEVAAKALRAKLHTHDDHDEWLKRNA